MHEKADLKQIMHDCIYLNTAQQNNLYRLLLKYESLFNGTLGDWNTCLVSLDLKPGTTPCNRKAYPISRTYEQCLRKEAERLVSIGVLEKCSDSE